MKKLTDKSILIGTIILIGCLIILGITIMKNAENNKEQKNKSAENFALQHKAKIQTSMGDIVIELFQETRPITVKNFKDLSEKNFYKGIIFHRVIDGFMIQAGCPYGTGIGGPGYTIPDEIDQKNRNLRGTISMANAGPNTGGSQFFINLADNNFLDAKHSVFGMVVKGMNVVEKIGKVATGEMDRPIDDVIIKNIEITSL